MKNHPLNIYLEIFNRAAARTKALLDGSKIQARVGYWEESAVLKLQKRSWKNLTSDTGQNDAEIFFSVWVEEKGLEQNRAFYNIHALKLRALEGHEIQSREFADAFRTAFAAAPSDWPHVSIDYGPQTLMQGWIDLENLENDAAVLVSRFIPLAELIDSLLDERAG